MSELFARHCTRCARVFYPQQSTGRTLCLCCFTDELQLADWNRISQNIVGEIEALDLLISPAETPSATEPTTPAEKDQPDGRPDLWGLW